MDLLEQYWNNTTSSNGWSNPLTPQQFDQLARAFYAHRVESAIPNSRVVVPMSANSPLRRPPTIDLARLPDAKLWSRLVELCNDDPSDARLEKTDVSARLHPLWMQLCPAARQHVLRSGVLPIKNYMTMYVADFELLAPRQALAVLSFLAVWGERTDQEDSSHAILRIELPVWLRPGEDKAILIGGKTLTEGFWGYNDIVIETLLRSPSYGQLVLAGIMKNNTLRMMTEIRDYVFDVYRIADCSHLIDNYKYIVGNDVILHTRKRAFATDDDLGPRMLLFNDIRSQAEKIIRARYCADGAREWREIVPAHTTDKDSNDNTIEQ